MDLVRCNPLYQRKWYDWKKGAFTKLEFFETVLSANGLINYMTSTYPA